MSPCRILIKRFSVDLTRYFLKFPRSAELDAIPRFFVSIPKAHSIPLLGLVLVTPDLTQTAVLLLPALVADAGGAPEDVVWVDGALDVEAISRVCQLANHEQGMADRRG